MMTTLRITRIIPFLLMFVIHNVAFAVMTVSAAHHDSGKLSPGSTVSDEGGHQQLPQFNHMMQEVLEAIEQTLQECEQNYASTSPIKSYPSSSMTEHINQIQKMFDQQQQLQSTREQLIHSLNTEHLKEQKQRLETTLLSVVEHTTTSMTASVTDGSDYPMENTTMTVVTSPELQRIMAPESILVESESILMEWMRSVIPQEINQLDVNSFISSFTSIQTKRQHSTVSSSSSFNTSKTCKIVEAAVEGVYYKLMRYDQDGVGRMDYAHSIVHQYTSPTYGMTNEDRTATLSTVWWNRYIPQDWEYLLPQGWKSWKVWTFIIPDHILHSLGGWWRGSIGSGKTCAPPETILHSSTLPGHCWPLSMMTKPARVTIRLQTSIIVTAISIDHSSKIELLPLPLRQHQKFNSAPKRIRVYGYTPCSENHCHGFGFDIKSKELIVELTYNTDDELNVQTFPIIYTDDAIARQSDVSSCSVTTTTGSCTGSSRNTTRVSAAVTLEILDNWGNADYTCLYRIRVHGEPIN